MTLTLSLFSFLPYLGAVANKKKMLFLFNRAYREYTIVFTEVNRVIFVSLPQSLLQLVLFGWLESMLRCVVDQIRYEVFD